MDIKKELLDLVDSTINYWYRNIKNLKGNNILFFNQKKLCELQLNR